MDTLFHLREGLQMFQRRIAVAKSGTKKYTGDAAEICQQIVADCWNGTFFQVSTGHFSLFYMRDFGMCVDALLKLGYKKEVEKTLQFALTVYSREKKVSTTISREGKGFDVFTYAPDTLAFLLYSLRKANAKELVDVYKPFLEQQISHFFNTVVDSETGLVKKNKNFSSIKDHAKRSVSCYDSCCIAVVAREAQLLELLHPFENYNYKKLLKDSFWIGSYFKDTLTHDYPSGDANIFPYWFKLFEEKAMIQKSIAAIQKEKLDQPFPLKYSGAVSDRFFFPLSLLAPNYEGNSVWPHLGLCFIEVVASVDKKLAKKYLQQYKLRIEEHQNFLELYDPAGKPYNTLFYYTDEGMVWASKWLVLVSDKNKT